MCYNSERVRDDVRKTAEKGFHIIGYETLPHYWLLLLLTAMCGPYGRVKRNKVPFGLHPKSF